MAITRKEREAQYEALKQEYVRAGKNRPTLAEMAASAAERLGVKPEAIEVYASRNKWVKAAKEWDEAIREATKVEVIQKHGGDYAEIESGCLAIAGRLIEFAGEYLNELEATGRQLPPSQLKAIAESIEKIYGIYQGSNSDIKIALTTLSQNHVLPPSVVPQILASIEETEGQLGERLQRIFAGQVPD